MGFGIIRKMRLKGHSVGACLRILRQQSGHRGVTSVCRDEEPALDGLVGGCHFPTLTVLNPENRIAEFDGGSLRNGMLDESLIEIFPSNSSLTPGVVRQ